MIEDSKLKRVWFWILRTFVCSLRGHDRQVLGYDPVTEIAYLYCSRCDDYWEGSL